MAEERRWSPGGGVDGLTNAMEAATLEPVARKLPFNPEDGETDSSKEEPRTPFTGSNNDSAPSLLPEGDVGDGGHATITVMNWNALSDISAQYSRESEANMLMDLKPSIYCRQEAKDPELNVVQQCDKSSYSDPYASYGHHIRDVKDNMPKDVGISYLLSQFNEDKTTNLDDDLVLDDAMKERVTCIQLEAYSGQKILVASVHGRAKTNVLQTPGSPMEKKQGACNNIINTISELADDKKVPLVIGGDWNTDVTKLNLPSGGRMYSADRAITRDCSGGREDIDGIFFYAPDTKFAVKAVVKNCFVIESNWWTMRWYKNARPLYTKRGGGHVPQLVAITSSKPKEDYPEVLEVFKAIGGEEL